MKNFGESIRNARIQQNLTQDALAEKLYVTRQTISNYENGRSEPDIETMQKLAEILKLDMNEVLGGTAQVDIQARWYWIALAVNAVCGIVLYRYLIVLQTYYRMMFVILPEYVIGMRAVIPYLVFASCAVLGSLAGMYGKKDAVPGSLRIVIRTVGILYLCTLLLFAVSLVLLRTGILPQLSAACSRYYLTLFDHPILIMGLGAVLGTVNGFVTRRRYNALYLTVVPLAFLIFCWLKYRLP